MGAPLQSKCLLCRREVNVSYWNFPDQVNTQNKSMLSQSSLPVQLHVLFYYENKSYQPKQVSYVSRHSTVLALTIRTKKH